MKLTYWIAECQNDSPVYSVRTRTRRECYAKLRQRWGDEWPTNYAPPKKVTVEYDNAFNLMEQCLSGEGTGWWEDVE